MKATVFGAGGFIGRALAKHLQGLDREVLALGRGDERWRGADLGQVFYCVGMTADFRTRPFETIEAHVGFAAEVLQQARFESFLYLSSTRVYAKVARAAEDEPLVVDPADPSDLYNLSKLMGEAACLALPRPEARVARLSNVVGPGMAEETFLGSVLRDARGGALTLRTDPRSAKDYISLDDAVAALVRVSDAGVERIYNVASGTNTTHAEIAEVVAGLTGCMVSVAAGSPVSAFPRIETARLNSLGFQASRGVLDLIPELIGSVPVVESESKH